MPVKVTARCTKCHRVLYGVTAREALAWLSSDPQVLATFWVPHKCWTAEKKVIDPVECFWCGEVFENGDFEALSRHVWTEGSCQGRTQPLRAWEKK